MIFSELECWSNATDNPYHGKQHLWPRRSLKPTDTCHTPWRMTPTQSPPTQNQTLSCQTHFHNLHNYKNFQSKILNNLNTTIKIPVHVLLSFKITGTAIYLAAQYWFFKYYDIKVQKLACLCKYKIRTVYQHQF